MDSGAGVTSLSPMVAEAAAAAQRAAAAFMAAQQASSNVSAAAVNLQMTAVVPAVNNGSVLPSKTTVSFVIPKNKLGVSKAGQTSGALVPISSSNSKWDSTEPKDEAKDQDSRKTRWGPDLLLDPVVRRGRTLALQTRAEQIAAQLESGNLEIDTNDATRSPSPPPIYGENGQRLNTREGRKRDQLEFERREAIGECIQLNPSYKPPAGFKPLLKDAKLFLPVKEYPGYNFIGLILGPRGNTQKRMEQETGAKIAIRGKGAVKDGKQGIRRDGKLAEGANEDLHVYISADTIEKVDAAVALIEPLLTPVDETRNSHKRKQLQELAKMNGTMRDFFCSICGEAGHRDWHCPKDKLQTFQAKVTCGICGDGGHPSADCPLKLSGTAEKVMDKEYAKLLAELGGDTIGAADTIFQPQVSMTPRSVPMAGPKALSSKSYPVGLAEGTVTGGFADSGGAQQSSNLPSAPPAWAMAVAASLTRDSEIATEEDIEKYANDEWTDVPQGASGGDKTWEAGARYSLPGDEAFGGSMQQGGSQNAGLDPMLSSSWNLEAPQASVDVRSRLNMKIGTQGGLLGPPPGISAGSHTSANFPSLGGPQFQPGLPPPSTSRSDQFQHGPHQNLGPDVAMQSKVGHGQQPSLHSLVSGQTQSHEFMPIQPSSGPMRPSHPILHQGMSGQSMEFDHGAMPHSAASMNNAPIQATPHRPGQDQHMHMFNGLIPPDPFLRPQGDSMDFGRMGLLRNSTGPMHGNAPPGMGLGSMFSSPHFAQPSSAGQGGAGHGGSFTGAPVQMGNASSPFPGPTPMAGGGPLGRSGLPLLEAPLSTVQPSPQKPFFSSPPSQQIWQPPQGHPAHGAHQVTSTQASHFGQSLQGHSEQMSQVASSGANPSQQDPLRPTGPMSAPHPPFNSSRHPVPPLQPPLSESGMTPTQSSSLFGRAPRSGHDPMEGPGGMFSSPQQGSSQGMHWGGGPGPQAPFPGGARFRGNPTHVRPPLRPDAMRPNASYDPFAPNSDGGDGMSNAAGGHNGDGGAHFDNRNVPAGTQSGGEMEPWREGQQRQVGLMHPSGPSRPPSASWSAGPPQQGFRQHFPSPPAGPSHPAASMQGAKRDSEYEQFMESMGVQ